ncbi:MAG: hypothetical protein BWY74_01597 [Firmicutes bacterium ADurb.Bin419]|jgi:hypothetical protein|nr:MAG: hypothetical protein BWY74_01597 [Firmicutes bacterium ADurb.Bin419]
MSIFYAVDGSTLFDVCLNTYGSLDFFYKLLIDNNIPNANYTPKTGQAFNYDETLIVDEQTNRTTTLSGIKYATAINNNTGVYYKTEEGLPKL